MIFQSNGMGMQSVAMYLMSCLGELPRFDYSIFADPGAEHPKTYEYLKRLKTLDIQIIHDTSKNLKEDILNKWNSERVASIPAFSENGGLIFRQCTQDYKISVVDENIRRLSNDKINDVYIGISLDEINRVFKPKAKNKRYIYPFCNLVVTSKTVVRGDFETQTRGQLKKWFVENGWPVPLKSSCVFCPFHDNKAWREIKKNKEAWDISVKIDEKIRNKKGMNERLYLHRSLKPLKEAYLQEDQGELNFDCYGFCDV